MENYYSQDDLVYSNSSNNKSSTPDQKQEDVSVLSKRTEAPANAEGPDTVNSAPAEDNTPFLSPSSNQPETVLVHSPIKRRRTADSTLQQYPHHSGAETWQRGAYDPIRSKYRVYHSPKVFNPVSPNGLAYMPEQQYVPKVVEAEYRRLADSAAAAIPSESLLSPAIWKEEFYWPNKFTTTQCACLMRYYIDHLASWVGVWCLCSLDMSSR